MKKQNRRS